MSENADVLDLAPLDELIALVPKLDLANERRRLGTALQKATANAETWKDLPERLEAWADLAQAGGASAEDFEAIAPALASIFAMARALGSGLTVEQLDQLNQVAFNQLSFQVDKIEQVVEAVWRRSVEDAIGGQRGLGLVLERIPDVQSLGRELSDLARRGDLLTDRARPAAWRIAERERLAAARAELTGKLEAAGIASEMVTFLLAIADGPVRLGDVSDAVLAWLRAHTAFDMFDLTVRSV